VIVDGRCDEVTDVALQVLELGLPILLEKPGGFNSKDLASVADAARKQRLAVQLGYFLRYADSVAAAKAAIDSGSLGDMTMVRCHAGMPHAAWDGLTGWLDDPANVTSIFQEDACHVVDITLHLLGMPKAAMAMRVKDRFSPSVGEDSLAAILDYGDFLATIDFNAHEANPWIDTWGFEIYGTSGTMRIGLAPDWVEIFAPATGWNTSGEDRLGAPAESGTRGADLQKHYERGLAGLIRAISTGDRPPVDADAGLTVFRTVEGIIRSADTGSRVELEG
jgi:predicted dehydrogenase